MLITPDMIRSALPLRPRQKIFTANVLNSLATDGNTLGIAPTGSGKSLMLSAICSNANLILPIDRQNDPIYILQHRDELLDQNTEKFLRIEPNAHTSKISSKTKDYSGKYIFGMIKTIIGETNIKNLRPGSLLQVDETHHIVSNEYLSLIEYLRSLNPNILISGVTATSGRSDKVGLGKVFSNCADQITLAEMIAEGYLVPPRTYRLNVEGEDIIEATRTSRGHYDDEAIANILTVTSTLEQMISGWRKYANERPTVAFTGTVDQAHQTAKAFNEAGIPSAPMWGEMPKSLREATIQAYIDNKIRLLTNANMLTEGFDHPPTSCVMILRNSSSKSALIQMVGRGLRPLIGEEYTGMIKRDCIVLDFGSSTKKHGSLEQEVLLNPIKGDGIAPKKACPSCGFSMHASIMECPNCGHAFHPKIKEFRQGTLEEIDPTEFSAFRWEVLTPSCIVANGITAGAVIVKHGEDWHAISCRKNPPSNERHAPLYAVKHLAQASKAVAIAASDAFLQKHADVMTADKSRDWLNSPPSIQQLQALPKNIQTEAGLNRYRASCWMLIQFNKKTLRETLDIAIPA